MYTTEHSSFCQSILNQILYADLPFGPNLPRAEALKTSPELIRAEKTKKNGPPSIRLVSFLLYLAISVNISVASFQPPFALRDFSNMEIFFDSMPTL